MRGFMMALSFIFICSSSAQAGPVPGNNFESIAEDVAKKCDIGQPARCTSPYFAVTYEGKDFRTFPKYMDLKKVAQSEAQIWGDTILEGPYASLGKTQLDRVVEIKRGSNTVGYYITFSERAVMTEGADCDFDYETEKWTGECETGRIRETIFVSEDLQSTTIVGGLTAEFYED